MNELGYGLAWRVLDAQFFGVAQRRRRVSLVGGAGDRGSQTRRAAYADQSEAAEAQTWHLAGARRWEEEMKDMELEKKATSPAVSRRSEDRRLGDG